MKLKYALVDGKREESRPKLRGACPNCEREVIAKCGQQRIWHWAHLGKLECDHWWEPETEWHRSWKSLFPQEWQEIVHIAADGERHIADVKTGADLVVEFQHSPITPDERHSRENFYKPMIWVVDGVRFKRDPDAFRRALKDCLVVNENPLLLKPSAGNTALFRRWAPIQSPVFIDFGDEGFEIRGFPLPQPVLWRLYLQEGTDNVLIAAVTRESFLNHCLNGGELQHLTLVRYEQPRGRTRPLHQLYGRRRRF
ncbi:competence protein CoiA [Neorhizobium galegae]|uniref:competence protein CoiA n=1 Tax=Neorhizobium galegae TaxID=399 RepID=UPI0021060B22|nr:competence protein CoiA family protein [Neorhizobium galegae]